MSSPVTLDQVQVLQQQDDWVQRQCKETTGDPQGGPALVVDGGLCHSTHAKNRLAWTKGYEMKKA